MAGDRQETSPAGAPLPAGRREKVRFSRRPWVQRAMARLVRFTVWAVRKGGPERSPAVASWIARRVAPLVPETRLARENLRLAFPEKTAAERKEILAGVWDNLARTTVEFVHLRARTMDATGRKRTARVEMIGEEHFFALRDDDKPGILFTAHLGNWELLALAAEMAGLPMVSLTRPPRNRYAAAELAKWRKESGRLVVSAPGAALELAVAMEQGAHLGMLVDQRFPIGPVVPFLGRPAASNPIIAKLARRFDCPVHGARCIRRPGGNFLIELTPPLDLPRDAVGDIDVNAATAMIQGTVEGWVREYPGQWLWLHDRWRLER